MVTIKLAALSARGRVLASVYVSPGETYDTIISIFTARLREDRARIASVSAFSQWRDGGYIIKNTEV